MHNVIPPVSRQLIEAELNSERFVRQTNNGSNDIYIVNWHNSPNILLEIGRLREISFRDAGGGTGQEYDLDDYDMCINCFEQLFVWNPRDREIVGGYRFIHGRDQKIDSEGNLIGPTGKLFRFNERFINDYLPYTIELGRSFVQPGYQPMVNIRKGMYSLDNIWDGLGAIIIDNPDIRYFFGKITMYTQFNTQARDMILYFLNRYFPDKENLACPFEPLKTETSAEALDLIFKGKSYDENYRILVQEVRQLKENIPPLVNAYMNLSPTMRTFGTAINYEFGNVEETGIMVTISDIHNIKKSRHLDTYKKEGFRLPKIKLPHFKFKLPDQRSKSKDADKSTT